MIPNHDLVPSAQLHGRVSTGQMSNTRSRSRRWRSDQPGPEVGLNTVITSENITREWGHAGKLFLWSTECMQTINEGASVASK